MMDKKAFRKRLKAVRAAYRPDWLAEESGKVCRHLAAWEQFEKASTVMGYLAFGNEVNIDWILQIALEKGKRVFVPFVPNGEKCAMQAVELLCLDDICTGRFDIRTVNTNSFADPQTIKLVLTPGLSFTKQGDRMGLGKGYYDAFFAGAAQALRIGVTLTPQLVDEMPIEEHDQKVDFLVTECGIIACR